MGVDAEAFVHRALPFAEAEESDVGVVVQAAALRGVQKLEGAFQVATDAEAADSGVGVGRCGGRGRAEGEEVLGIVGGEWVRVREAAGVEVEVIWPRRVGEEAEEVVVVGEEERIGWPVSRNRHLWRRMTWFRGRF